VSTTIATWPNTKNRGEHIPYSFIRQQFKQGLGFDDGSSLRLVHSILAPTVVSGRQFGSDVCYFCLIAPGWWVRFPERCHAGVRPTNIHQLVTHMETTFMYCSPKSPRVFNQNGRENSFLLRVGPGTRSIVCKTLPTQKIPSAGIQRYRDLTLQISL